MVAEVWERSAAVHEAPCYVTYQYLEQVNSAFVNSALYKEHASWERPVMYELQSVKLPRVFQSLPDSGPAPLGSMNQSLCLELL